MGSFFPELSTRVWLVWRRDFDVFRRLFLVNFALPMVEPILYLVALGFGLGMFVKQINGVPYSKFIAPGLISMAMMYASFFECTFASYVRMYYQRTFDAIVATPLNVDEVVAGEILWGATRSAINATLVTLVVIAFRLASPFLILVTPVLGLGCGLLFGSMGMIATSLVPSIDFFNYPIFLYITPMFLFSGTFFPLEALPKPVQTISWAILPLSHVVRINRALVLGRLRPGLLLSLGWLALMAVVAFFIALRMMKRRLIK
jgi:lipooligosaccharide transport system permease protein